MYLAYYVHLVRINEATDCENVRSGKLQNIRSTYGHKEMPRSMRVSYALR